MNRDIHLIFEAYKKKQMALINETDIGAEFGSSLGAVSSGVAEREKSADTYIFKLLKSKNPDKTHDEIVKMVVEPLYNAIFVNNKFSAHGSHKDQLAKLQTTLENELAKSYPRAQSSYTARIIKNFLAPVVKILDAEPGAVEGGKEAVRAVKQAVDKAAAKNEVSAPETGESETPAGEGGSTDRTTVRIEQLLADNVDDSGVLIKYVIDSVVQEIRDSGGLGLKEGEDKKKVERVLDSLISKQIFEKKGEHVKLGKNFEKFEAGGEQGSSVLSDEDLIQHVTGFGARSTTGRQVWGREGGSRHGVDFG